MSYKAIQRELCESSNILWGGGKQNGLGGESIFTPTKKKGGGVETIFIHADWGHTKFYH